MQQYPQDNPIQIMFENPERKELITRAIEMVNNSNIVNECYRYATEFRDKACSELQYLPDVPARRSLLDLADFVVARRK